MSILNALISNPLAGEKKPWKPWYGYLFLVIVVVCVGLYLYQRVNGGPVIPTFADPVTLYENAKAARERQEVVAETDDDAINAALDDIAKVALEIIAEPLPESADLAVPFMTQAPSGVWDDAHINASEEASWLMTLSFFVPDATMNEVELEKIRVAMVDEKLSMATFASFVETYDPGFRATVIEDPTVEEIQRYLADGVPVIVPTDGALLENPFYIAAGLPYHCIVLRGYAGENFIANDPGTRRGEAYEYAQSTVMGAMSDWNDDEALRGGKRILVIQPN